MLANVIFNGSGHRRKKSWIGDVGENYRCSANRSTTISATFLLTTDGSISSLWQLDVLGISDPCEQKSKIDQEGTVKESFKQIVTINEERRYEMMLPWMKDIHH